jgi:hypothetical protein
MWNILRGLTLLGNRGVTLAPVHVAFNEALPILSTPVWYGYLHLWCPWRLSATETANRLTELHTNRSHF